jgi:hypothetical protein
MQPIADALNDCCREYFEKAHLHGLTNRPANRRTAHSFTIGD